MSFLEFIVWIFGIIFVGIPALGCLTVIAVAWIDSRSERCFSHYGPAVEEPEEEA